MSRPFHPSELHGSDVPGAPGELEQALESAGLIESAATADEVLPSPGFTSRVMAAVTSAPAPRRGRAAALIAGLRATWQTALSAGQPPRVRARAMVIVLAALIILGSMGGAVTLAAAGALRLIVPPPPASVPTLVPEHRPSPGPSDRATPGERPEPSEGVEPRETPERSEAPEPEASDNGGGGVDGGGDDDGGAGGRSVSPRPSHLPEPGETPGSSSSPEPDD